MFNSFVAGGNAVVHGASRGIGLEFVRQLLAEPKVACVFATCRDPGGALELQGLAAAWPDRLVVLPMDVTRESSIAAAAAQVSQGVARVHFVMTCSGVLHDATHGLKPEKRLADISPESLAHAYAVNAIGPALVAKHFERFLAHQERAVFAALSARVGSIGDNRMGGWHAYRGSKAGLNMLLRTAAVEWARTRRNVICVALHPGTTDTGLSRPFQANVPAGQLFPAERSVRQLLSVIDGLQPRDSGHFFAWDGAPIPW